MDGYINEYLKINVWFPIGRSYLSVAVTREKCLELTFLRLTVKFCQFCFFSFNKFMPFYG